MGLTYDAVSGILKANKLQNELGGAPSIQGVVDGTSAAAGNVGEIVAATLTTNTVASTSNVEVDITGATISLTAGQWLVFIGSALRMESDIAGRNIAMRVRMTDISNSAIPGSAIYRQISNTPNPGAYTDFCSIVVSLNITLTGSYKLRLTPFTSAGSVNAYWLAGDQGIFTGLDNDSYFYGIRVR